MGRAYGDDRPGRRSMNGDGAAGGKATVHGRDG